MVKAWVIWIIGKADYTEITSTFPLFSYHPCIKIFSENNSTFKCCLYVKLKGHLRFAVPSSRNEPAETTKSYYRQIHWWM